jgi:hypothetical protein
MEKGEPNMRRDARLEGAEASPAGGEAAGATDAGSERRSRRRFLAAGAGGVAAILAGELSRTPAAEAANGDPVTAGHNTDATAPTKVTNTADTGAGIWGIASGGSRHGVYGTNTGGGHGVGGSAGAGGAGVHGINTGNTYGVWGDAPHGIAVYATTLDGMAIVGFTTSDQHVAIEGTNFGSAPGVRGSNGSPTGVGVEASAGGVALNVMGVAAFDRSGVATVKTGQASVKVKVTPLSGSSLVLATVQQSAGGCSVRCAEPDPGSESFTITLDKKAPVNVRVAWFVLN